MKLNRVFAFLTKRICYFPYLKALKRRQLNCYQASGKYGVVATRFFSISPPLKLSTNENDEIMDEEIDIEYDLGENYIEETDESCARDLLYKNTSDPLLIRISNSVSVEELLNVFRKSKSRVNSEHLVQTTLVLYDLKKIFHDINNNCLPYKNVPSNDFIEQLKQNDSFQKLLVAITQNVGTFNVTQLGVLVLYLNKLGLGIESDLLQILSLKLCKDLVEDFQIDSAARYLESVFSVTNLRSYFMAQDIIPFVINQIDTCPISNFGDLTVCLNKLNNVLSDETIEKYKNKVVDFLENQQLNSNSYVVILKIISLLNYPKWRNKNTELISNCILVMKDTIHKLNLNEILVLYEVFFKTQEPAEILSELQRSTSKYLRQLDGPISAKKITLFSSLIYFAFPSHRIQYQNMLKSYVNECNTIENLILLRKLLSYIKMSDLKLCEIYWDKVFKYLKADSENVNIIKLSENYINFTSGLESYRHYNFEQEMLAILEDSLKNTYYEFIPQKVSSVLAFTLIYGTDMNLIDFLINKIEQNWEQLKHLDCLRLAQSLRILNQRNDKYLKISCVKRINKVLNLVIAKEMSTDEHFSKNGTLLKSAIFKKYTDVKLMNELLRNFIHLEDMCSKNIETISYCFLSTSTLIPEVLEHMIDYTTRHKDNLIGFNIEKILYLFYWLGYQPKNADKFFEIASNVIIRDQERMGGLCLIQCALALCYCNKLSNSLIKSIFNVEFLDKLDAELQNCYSKEKYPQRVRSTLMLLNRAVCLDYPQANVPWFHQKYVDEINKAGSKISSKTFFRRVKETLLQTFLENDTILENEISPYGYRIDFVVNISSGSDLSQSDKKLAFLLIPQFAYTQMCVQLKGKYQMKKRHLEMLGYRVILINFSEWICFYFPDERIDFISKLVWPKKFMPSQALR